MGATRQPADRMDELVLWIGFPTRRLPAASHHDTWSVRRGARFGLDGGGKMHDQGDRAQDTLGVINETNQLAQRGLAAQVQNSVQSRMVVVVFSDLDK